MNTAKNIYTQFNRRSFITKVKGMAASVAPCASVIALSVALGASPAVANDLFTGVVYGGNGSLNYGTQFTLQGNLTLDSSTFAVPGPSIFSGNVDITGTTDINNTLNVDVGVTTLDVNGTSFNVQVGTSTSNLDMTTTSVNLSADGNGFSAAAGDASVTGTTSAVVFGGTSSINVTDTGVALSGSGGAPVLLSGVADPVSGTDAVNLRTMQREFGALESKFGALESNMSAGIAQSMAMAQLPYPDPGKDYSFGIALGGFNGKGGFAMGGTARLEANMVLRGAASYSDAGGTGGALGVGWSW